MSVRAFGIITAAFLALMSVTGRGMAEEGPEDRLVHWRNDSTTVSGTAARTLIKQQFTDFDPRYTTQKQQFEPQVTAAARQIAALELKGRMVPCSKQIYLEAKWLLN